MNIVTPQPAMNLNTSNVYTETARRDNQLREVIPKPAPTNASHTENKTLNDGDKSRSHLTDEGGTYDSAGQLQQNKVIAEDEEQQGQQQSKGSEEENSEQEQQNQEAEQQQIEELKARDREVRLHEQAHARVGGQYAGSPSYEYQRGPDGNNYAVGGQVMIDVAEVPNDPKATIDKMQTVRAAALAPAEPSGADRAIAADATQKMASAQADLAQQVISGDEESKSESGSVATYETRRLNEEDRADNELQTLEKASLQSEGDPYAVALPIEPDPEIQARALRISDFYQHVAVPNSNSNLSLSV
ncbi:MAG: catalase [Pseudoalteromonas sp.]|jgi:hypothetical protein|nr:catalase [Pseudoalteromonas sp.]|tara:strand:+ start:14831 stop:15736 length:906 start_codon:yes stop_codon:yes gene_type:complete